MKRKILAMATVAMVLVMSPSRMFAQAGDPASVASAFSAAGLDPEAEMGMVTDDVTIRIIPAPPGTQGVWTGKAQARGLFEFGKGQNIHRELVGNWQVAGDKVTGTVMVTNNDFAKWNVGPVQHQLEFVIQDGKVKSLTSIMAPAERPRVMAAAQAYQAAQSAPPPAGMPRTGAAELMREIVLGLLVAGMCLVGAGVAVLRTRPGL